MARTAAPAGADHAAILLGVAERLRLGVGLDSDPELALVESPQDKTRLRSGHGYDHPTISRLVEIAPLAIRSLESLGASVPDAESPAARLVAFAQEAPVPAIGSHLGFLRIARDDDARLGFGDVDVPGTPGIQARNLVTRGRHPLELIANAIEAVVRQSEYTPPTGGTASADSQERVELTYAQRRKIHRETVTDQMARIYTRDPGTIIDKSKRWWATELGCSETAVQNSPIWGVICKDRADQKKTREDALRGPRFTRRRGGIKSDFCDDD